MRSKMNAAVLYGKKELRFEAYAMPVVNQDEVLVKITCNGLCGSDIHFYEDGKLGPFSVDEPYIPGHEATGVICEKGLEVPDKFQSGDRIVIEPGIPCRKCNFCKTERYNLCQNVRFLSAPPENGTFAEYVSVPYDFIHPLPDSVSDEMGAMIEPASVAVHAFARLNIQAGNSLTILGAGPIGLITLITARAYGLSEIYIVDMADSRLRAAKDLGVQAVINAGNENVVDRILELTKGKGTKYVIDTTGSSHACSTAPEIAEIGGKIALIGWPEKSTFEYPIEKIIEKELDIVGINRYANTFPKVISMIASGQLDLTPVISHRFSFSEVCEAFAYASGNKFSTLKVVIKNES
jgi:L-iditol 2-dehydrogenase